MRIGRFVITFTLIATMVLPILIHWNRTHVFNPTWPGHARGHVVLAARGVSGAGRRVDSGRG
jgi:hypothetical protein